MLQGLKAEPINVLISLKRTLPAVTQLLKELNEYVKQENKSTESAANIGSEYALKNINGFTPITIYR